MQGTKVPTVWCRQHMVYKRSLRLLQMYIMFLVYHPRILGIQKFMYYVVHVWCLCDACAVVRVDLEHFASGGCKVLLVEFVYSTASC